jgi:hypothetical protein
LPALGVNCAACHVAEIHSSATAAPVRVLGATSHFDAEAFVGVVVVSTFRTSEPANMKLFLSAYVSGSDNIDTKVGGALDRAWAEQEATITAAMAADPFGSKNVEPGTRSRLTTCSSRKNPPVRSSSKRRIRS